MRRALGASAVKLAFWPMRMPGSRVCLKRAISQTWLGTSAINCVPGETYCPRRADADGAPHILPGDVDGAVAGGQPGTGLVPRSHRGPIRPQSASA